MGHLAPIPFILNSLPLGLPAPQLPSSPILGSVISTPQRERWRFRGYRLRLEFGGVFCGDSEGSSRGQRRRALSAAEGKSAQLREKLPVVARGSHLNPQGFSAAIPKGVQGGNGGKHHTPAEGKFEQACEFDGSDAT